ncbi:MAG: hypothetical protein ACKOA9_01480 [Actinomycetota bacterium]
MQSRFGAARRMAAAGVVVTVAGLLAGCGGGGSARLSADALDRRARAVCAAGQEEADRLRSEAAPGARGEAAAREIDATREVLESQIRGFAGLRGPASTDEDLDRLVGHLRAAAAGLATLRDVAAARDLTVDETIRARGDVVEQVNRSSAQAADDLVALGWLTCIGLTGG